MQIELGEPGGKQQKYQNQKISLPTGNPGNYFSKCNLFHVFLKFVVFQLFFGLFYNDFGQKYPKNLNFCLLTDFV